MIWNRERHEKVWESPQINPNHKKQKQWRFQGDHLPVETPEACWYWRRHCAIEVANIGVFNSPKCIIYTSYTLLHFVTVCSSMFVGEATMWLGTGDWSLPLTAWLSVWRPAGTYWKWGSLSMYARDPARSSGLSQSSLLENAGNCGFAHRGCLSPAFSSRLSQSDPIFLGERERDIYMILWNGVGSSTQILLNHNYVLVHQQLNTCRFFLGGSSPPSTRTRRRHCQRKQRKQSKDDPGGFLLGHE